MTRHIAFCFIQIAVDVVVARLGSRNARVVSLLIGCIHTVLISVLSALITFSSF